MRTMTLVCLCISLCVSISIFSCRVTSGKIWLKTLVAAGLITLIAGLFSIIITTISSNGSESLFWVLMCLFGIALFFGIFVYIIVKLTRKANKGYSSVLLNLLIWLVPCLIPLLLLGYSTFSKRICDLLFYDNLILSKDSIFWINIPIVVIVMIFIADLVHRWKGLPDE